MAERFDAQCPRCGEGIAVTFHDGGNGTPMIDSMPDACPSCLTGMWDGAIADDILQQIEDAYNPEPPSFLLQ